MFVQGLADLLQNITMIIGDNTKSKNIPIPLPSFTEKNFEKFEFEVCTFLKREGKITNLIVDVKKPNANFLEHLRRAIKVEEHYFTQIGKQNTSSKNKYEKFLKLQAKNTNLFTDAFLMGHLELLEDLIQCGADVNSKSPDTLEPLLYSAASTGCTERVRLFLKYNADPNVFFSNGATPLHAACCYNHPEIAKILIQDERCDPCPENDDGVTPLQMAVFQGHNHFVEIFLDAGVDFGPLLVPFKGQEPHFSTK